MDMFLTVEHVDAQGVCHDYNKHVHKQNRIKPRDQIIAVNGIEGDAIRMARELRDKRNVTLQVQRSISLE